MHGLEMQNLRAIAVRTRLMSQRSSVCAAAGSCVILLLPVEFADNVFHCLAAFLLRLALLFVVFQALERILDELCQPHSRSLPEAPEELRVQLGREVVAAVDPYQTLSPGDHRHVDRFADALVCQ